MRWRRADPCLRTPWGLLPQRIREVLHLARGNLAEAARSLGPSSRFALYRRIRQLGLELATLRDLPADR